MSIRQDGPDCLVIIQRPGLGCLAVAAPLTLFLFLMWKHDWEKFHENLLVGLVLGMLILVFLSFAAIAGKSRLILDRRERKAHFGLGPGFGWRQKDDALPESFEVIILRGHENDGSLYYVKLRNPDFDLDVFSAATHRGALKVAAEVAAFFNCSVCDQSGKP